MQKKPYISMPVIRRLPRYYRFLRHLDKRGVTRISSKELSEKMGFTASQVRQDFNCFGGYGQQGYGYGVHQLCEEIGSILGVDRAHKCILIGAGNLGKAIATHISYNFAGFDLIGIFDNSEQVVGQQIADLRVLPAAGIRRFWIDHGKACRRIAEYIGKELGTTVMDNHWVPDGMKDIPVDRYAFRQRLMESYDEIFSEKIDRKYTIDSVEGKVFGIGAESCTIGSHEFYLAYAQKHGMSLTLDTGHYHPTEVVSDKISSALLFLDDILLHVSRPVRWDSDHVVIFDDELKYIAQEILWGGFERRVHIGLDFFDASINRIAAWVIGTRSMQKALLFAALAPVETLRAYENSGDYSSRLALLEEIKTLPFAAVWDMYCEKAGVPVREKWLGDVKAYEKDVLSHR